MEGRVIIVDYNPQWPILYKAEKERVLNAIKHMISAIEHIGSTAVPGLGAKPIIDMMVGVKSLRDADECVPLLQNIGYTDITPQPDDPEWFYCCGKGSHSIACHLHLMKYMSNHWKRHLLFRDFLRTHPEGAQKYYDLKKKLAATYGADRIAYTEAKTAFITSVLAKAEHI